MRIIALIAVVLLSLNATAQKAKIRDTSRVVIPELKVKFNSSGTHYFKSTILVQNWARYSEMNPGTTIDGTPKSAYGDIGIRRWRVQAYAQLTDRLFLYTQFGQNNLGFLAKRHTGAFLHDAVTEYKAASWFYMGGGLTGWSGMSRFSSPAVASILTLDAPLYQQATNGVNEQFVRKLSVYAKGDIHRLNYRVAIASPMSTLNSTVTIPPISVTSNFSTEPGYMQTNGYLMWQFFDKETTTVPYMTGTYLGKKKILNLGFGWVHQKNAMWHVNELADTVRTDLLLLGVDVFADLPIGRKGAAFTAYVAYNNFDFGRDYIRMNGAMNPGNGVDVDASLNGPGVNYPMIGTGDIVFAQVGYKFRNDLLPDNGTLQPYASVQYSNFEGLDDAAIVYEAGLNWLIHGTHTGKVSLGIQSRPVFETTISGAREIVMYKNMYVLQYQISL